MKMALLVVDVQKAFIEHEAYKNNLLRVIPYINEVSKYFRDNGHPVVFIRDDSVDKSSDKFNVADELLQVEGDIYVDKHYNNAFWKTNLEQTLKDLDVDFIIVSGFAVPYCVLSTYLGAEERDFHVSFLQNGITGESLDAVKQVQFERNVINYKALKYFMYK